MLGDQNAFPAMTSFGGVTHYTKMRTKNEKDTQICIVDTPGFFDSEMTEDHVKKEVVKSVGLATPGPHVFIIVIQVGRFTMEKSELMKKLKDIFCVDNKDLLPYTMVVFTHTEGLNDGELKMLISNGPNSLKTLVEECENRYVGVENSQTIQKRVIKAAHIMAMAFRIKHKNSDRFYEDESFQIAHRALLDEANEHGTDFEQERAGVENDDSPIFKRLFASLIDKLAGFAAAILMLTKKNKVVPQ